MIYVFTCIALISAASNMDDDFHFMMLHNTSSDIRSTPRANTFVDVPNSERPEGLQNEQNPFSFYNIAKTLKSRWLSGIQDNLEEYHRGDWITWISMGGSDMVSDLRRGDDDSYETLGGIFLLASQLAATRAPRDTFDVVAAIGFEMCDSGRWEMFWKLVESFDRLSRFIIDLNRRGKYMFTYKSRWTTALTHAPWAYLNLACRGKTLDWSQKNRILTHRIARLIINSAPTVDRSEDLRIFVSTSASLDENLTKFLSIPSSLSRQKIDVRYTDDIAVGDGVYRDWLVKLGKQILTSDLVSLQSGKYIFLTDDAIDASLNGWKFIAIGRWLALCIIENITIGVEFRHSFYQVVMGKTKFFLEDVSLDDPLMYQSLLEIEKCKHEDNCQDLGLTFESIQGQQALGDYDPNTPVTEDNVEEYIRLLIQHELYDSRSLVYEKILNGFNTVLSGETLDGIFSSSEIAKLIKGETIIDIDNLKTHVTVLDRRTSGTDRSLAQLIEWFWTFISGRAMQLVHFVTGMTSLGNVMPKISLRIIDYVVTDPMPKAHLCYDQIDLPAYGTEAELCDRLSEAFVQTDLGVY